MVSVPDFELCRADLLRINDADEPRTEEEDEEEPERVDDEDDEVDDTGPEEERPDS